jgi:hypothetical protein
MIGVNPLRTKVLITADEVIFHAPTDQQVDIRILLQSIIIAERRFIEPVLCSTVYDALINAKNKIVTTDNKATLQAEVNAGRPADRAQIILNEGDYVNSDTYLSTSQLALWQDHLHKITAECVWLVALPVNRARFNSAGVMKNNPETITDNRASVTVDLADMKHLLDKGLNERVTVLIGAMHNYLCKVKYSGYDRDCGCGSKEVSTQKSSGVIFGLYDDDKPQRRWDS